MKAFDQVVHFMIDLTVKSGVVATSEPGVGLIDFQLCFTRSLLDYKMVKSIFIPVIFTAYLYLEFKGFEILFKVIRPPQNFNGSSTLGLVSLIIVFFNLFK